MVDLSPMTVPRDPVSTGLRLGEAFRILRTRWMMVAGLALLGAVLAALATKVVPQRYTAAAQILIQPNDLRVVDNAVTQRNGVTDSSIAQVESQAQVITSNNVLARVVERERLADDPEFGAGQPGLRTRLAGWLGTDAGPEPDRRAEAMRALDQGLSVRRAERSFVVDVSVRAGEPAKAARLANAVVEAYLAEQATARAEAARRATTSLEARLGELKERVRVSEEQAATFKARNNLIVANGRLLGDQQITELTSNLAAARDRVATARARHDQIQNPQTGADPAAISEAVQSPIVATLRAQYAEISRNEADLGAKLGPRHPQVTEVRTQLRRVRNLIEEEIGRLRAAARGDLDRAQANEATVSHNLNALKRDAATTEQALVRLRELDRDVEASRGVYRAYLNRARETGEQGNLDTDNARIISHAEPPAERSSPPRTLVLLAFGLAGGLGIGVGGALLQGMRDTRVISVERLAAATGRPVMAPVELRDGASARPRWTRAWGPSSEMQRSACEIWHRLAGAQADTSVARVLILGNNAASTTVALGHAVGDAAADAGASPLVIDFTTRGRAAGSAGGAIGWSELASGRSQLDSAIRRERVTGADRLSLCPLDPLIPRGPDEVRLRRIFDDAGAYVPIVMVLDRTVYLPRWIMDWADSIILAVPRDLELEELDTFLAFLGANRAKLAGSVLLGSNSST